MIQVQRKCFSPACRGEERRHRVSCDLHPDGVDCTGTCADRLRDREGVCVFCGGSNGPLPPDPVPFRLTGEPPPAEAVRPPAEPGPKPPAAGDRGRKERSRPPRHPPRRRPGRA